MCCSQVEIEYCIAGATSLTFHTGQDAALFRLVNAQFEKKNTKL